MPTLPVLKPSVWAPITLLRDAAVAALPDVAVAIDEVVVANVVPAVRLHVVGVDRADDRRHVGLGVVVRRVACGARRPCARRARTAVGARRRLSFAPQSARVRIVGCERQARGAERQSRAPVRGARSRRSRAARCTAPRRAQLDDAPRTGPDRLGDRDARSRMDVLARGQRCPAPTSGRRRCGCGARRARCRFQRAPTRSNANGARTGAPPATGRLARRTSAAPATAGADSRSAPVRRMRRRCSHDRGEARER